MQTQMVLNLGPALMPDFMTGALFHSILAWPTFKEVSSFQRVSEELMAGTIRLTEAEDPAPARSVMGQWPQYNWPSIEARARKPKSALGYLEKRLTQRMAAARAGIGKIHEQIFDNPAALSEGLTALSIDQLCTLIKSDVSISDPENIEKLVWRKSLPIIHLAMAIQLILKATMLEGTRFGIDLQDIDFYRAAVRYAGALEPLVAKHPEFAVRSDELTQIRWVE